MQVSRQLTNEKESDGYSLGGSCQTYQCQETGAVICPYGAVSTWAIWCSEVSDGLGLVVSTGQVHWGPSYRDEAQNKMKRLRTDVRGCSVQNRRQLMHQT